MPAVDTVLGTEFSPQTTYLNTASHGLLPARAATAVRQALTESVEGRLSQGRWMETVEAARAAFARLCGTVPERVALGTAVSVHVGLVAAALPAGAEVLAPEGEFTSVVTPFATRGDLVLRTVPLDRLAEAVRPRTALVAVSAVQSVDGRVVDLAAVRRATAAVGARLLVDTSQATGWLPVRADDADYLVCGAYKWLLCPRSVSFLTVPEDGGGLRPLYAGLTAAQDLRAAAYDPVRRFADSARRFDQSVPYLSYLGAVPALELVEELGQQAIGDHDRALARRFRAGLARLGHQAVPGDAPIVTVPGLGGAVPRLRRAGVEVSERAGGLRVAFHLYNTKADVDRALAVLAGEPVSRPATR